MTPAQIRVALKDKKSSQAQIAAALEVTQASVFRVINRLNVSDRIMRAIAEAIGKPVQKVFPEYYLAAPKNSRSKAFGRKPPDREVKNRA